MMKKLNDYTLKLDNIQLVPLVQGGMGFDVSTPKMAVEVAKHGGVGHISDMLGSAIVDKYFGTNFVQERRERYKRHKSRENMVHTVEEVHAIQSLLVRKTMEQKVGKGLIFINMMEKITMNNGRETLKARLEAAMDNGIDGISLAAGLHLKTLGLIKDHPRFRDVKLGIIVSSLRALKPFLKTCNRESRLPDFIVVEGPLAGGHLGFPAETWFQFDLKTITKEILLFLKEEDLKIPVIPAGGIFTGEEAVSMMNLGASAVQVGTRFAVTEESALPDWVKQRFFQAKKEEIVVNMTSPTGYPMRMLSDSRCLDSTIEPQCESYGYCLDRGKCSYIENRAEKFCICHHIRTIQMLTCGAKTYRLKETANLLPDGTYRIPTVQDVMNDYLTGS